MADFQNGFDAYDKEIEDLPEHNDDPLVDYVVAEAIPTKRLRCGKEFPATKGFWNVDAEEDMKLGGTPWTDSWFNML